ncbi:MAG: hypothetical protein AAF790_02000 [Planctomycetota bacterium]
MHLFIARHAWAGDFGDPAWPDDSLRELTAEGAQRYTRMIRLLAERGLAPRRIATSPYTRCRQTAEIMASEIVTANGGAGRRPEIDVVQALAPGAGVEAVLDWAAAHAGAGSGGDAAGDLAVVGHNPDVGFAAAALVGDGRAAVRFAKGAIAAIRFSGKPARGGGELVWHVTAKALGV